MPDLRTVMPEAAADNGLALATANQVAELVRERYPEALALILTGSAARNEATFLRAGSEVRWLSDIEFLVVIPAGQPVMQVAGKLNVLAREIGEILRRRGIQVSVELSQAPERYFAAVQPHLFGYELLVHGRQLYGEQDYLARIPRFSATSISNEEAWRLTSNRILELLDFECRGASWPLHVQFYALTKQYIDLLTSLSICTGEYAPSYRERAAAVARIVAGIDSGVPALELSPRFAEAVALATEFKQSPGSPRFGFLHSTAPGSLREVLDTAGWGWFYDELPDLSIAVWRWQLSRFSGVEVKGSDTALEAMRQIWGVKEMAKGWGRLLRSRQARAEGAVACFLRLFPSGIPRALVYAGAARLLETSAHPDLRALSWVRWHMPLLPASGAESWDALAGHCVRFWETWLRRTQI